MLPLYDNIRRRRIELGMSQQDLAEKMGYTSRTTIAKIEAGKIDIPNSKVIEFGKALGIHPGQLMGWTDKNNINAWRYMTIENDKLAIKTPGLANHPFENNDYILDIDPSPNSFILSYDEKKIIEAYRAKPEMHSSIHKLLDIADETALAEDMAQTVTETARHPIGKK